MVCQITKMKIYSFAVLLVECCLLNVQGETFLDGMRGILPCVGNSDVTEIYTWSDLSGGVPIYTVSNAGSSKSEAAKNNPKYDEFDVDEDFPATVNLTIDPVSVEHGGGYRCQGLTRGFSFDFIVDVEVIASSVFMDPNGSKTVNATESYTFTCTAVGVRSQNALNFTWSTNSVLETAYTQRSMNSENSALQDLNSTFKFMPEKDDTSLKCVITGYVNQGEINEDAIADTISLVVQYTPICSLQLGQPEVSDGKCTLLLMCNCDANPGVSADGFSYFNMGSSVIGNSNTTTADVLLGITAGFSCSAMNRIGSGEQSPVVAYTCTGTTTLPSTPSETTKDTTMIDITTNSTEPEAPPTEQPPTSPKEKGTTDTPGKGLSTGAIVGIVFAVLVVVVTPSGVAVYFIFFRETEPEPKPDPDNSAAGGGNTNPTYTEPESEVLKKDSQITSESSPPPVYGVVNKPSTKKKSSDNQEGNGLTDSTANQPEYAAVNKPPRDEPQPAPRTSGGGQPEKMELQYADLDHSKNPSSGKIHQPEETTEYATVQSVIV